jgi:GT2 family glycosyltransferase
MEVIIADDGSTDHTRSEVAQFVGEHSEKPWRYLHHSVNRGKAAVCNEAIRMANSPLILFLDDDCVPEPAWAENHVKRHAESMGPISVLGAVEFPSDWVAESNFVRYLNSRYIGNRDPRSVKGGIDDLSPNYFAALNTSVPREQLLQVGLFDGRIGRGQDVELGYRLWKARVRLVFDPNALVVHHSPEALSMQEWLCKATRAYQYTTPLMKRIHPEYSEKFGHWFLEPPVPGREPISRTTRKLVIRLLVQGCLARWLQSFLERSDRDPRFYVPIFYQYVFVSAALDRVDRRDSS